MLIFAKKEQLFTSKVSYIVLFVSLSFTAQGQYAAEYKTLLLPEYYSKALLTEDSIKLMDTYDAALKYLDLGRTTLNHNEILASKYELHAKEIFIKLGIDSMVADANLSLSFPYINLGKYDEAQAIIEEVVSYAKKQNNEAKLGQAYLRYGYLEQARGRYDKSLSFFLKTMDIYERIYPIERLGDITNRVGSAYIAIGDCSSAISIYENFLDELKKAHKTSGFITAIQSNLASCYIENKEVMKAKDLLKSAIEFRKKSNDPKMLSAAYRKMSQVAILENNIEYALMCIDTALTYGHSYNNNKTLAGLYQAKGNIYLKNKNQYKASIPFFKKSLNYAQIGNSPTREKEAYDALANLYASLKDYTNAYYYSTKRDSIKNILYSDEVITAVKNLEKSRIEQNSKVQIDLLEAQNKLKNDILTKEKNINKINRFVLCLLGLLLVLVSYVMYQRTKNNKILKEKNLIIEQALDSNKILVKEIHHRVKNNLQIISSFLGLQSRFSKDANVTDALLESKVRVQAMSILHQNLYNKQSEEDIEIKKYFEDLCSNISNTFMKHDLDVRIITRIENINMNLDQTVTLGIIVNELITNAYKHAFNDKNEGEIRLVIRLDKDKVNCIVSDNGQGCSLETLPNRPDSMGLQLIKSFSQKLEADLEITNENGCQFTLSFLLNEDKELY